MIFKLKEHIPSETKDTDIYVSPCIICGSDDIDLKEYEDNWGCISTATCKNCKNELKENVGIKNIIKDWNKLNNIPTVIYDKTELIFKLSEEVQQLKQKLKQREKLHSESSAQESDTTNDK